AARARRPTATPRPAAGTERRRAHHRRARSSRRRSRRPRGGPGRRALLPVGSIRPARAPRSAWLPSPVRASVLPPVEGARAAHERGADPCVRPDAPVLAEPEVRVEPEVPEHAAVVDRTAEPADEVV